MACGYMECGIFKAYGEKVMQIEVYGLCFSLGVDMFIGFMG
jgi:hypothetical protein